MVDLVEDLVPLLFFIKLYISLKFLYFVAFSKFLYTWDTFDMDSHPQIDT